MRDHPRRVFKPLFACVLLQYVCVCVCEVFSVSVDPFATCVCILGCVCVFGYGHCFLSCSVCFRFVCCTTKTAILFCTHRPVWR